MLLKGEQKALCWGKKRYKSFVLNLLAVTHSQIT